MLVVASPMERDRTDCRMSRKHLRAYGACRQFIITDTQRFTPENSIRNTGVGTITLLPSHITEDGVEYLELSVSDNGRGLDEQLIEKIMRKTSLSLLISNFASPAQQWTYWAVGWQ